MAGNSRGCLSSPAISEARGLLNQRDWASERASKVPSNDAEVVDMSRGIPEGNHTAKTPRIAPTRRSGQRADDRGQSVQKDWLLYIPGPSDVGAVLRVLA